MMNFGLKWLSVKTLINKDNFGIVGEFLMRWKFDFLDCKVGESGLVSGVERYGVRYGIWWDEFGILLDFIGNLMD